MTPYNEVHCQQAPLMGTEFLISCSVFLHLIWTVRQRSPATWDQGEVLTLPRSRTHLLLRLLWRRTGHVQKKIMEGLHWRSRKTKEFSHSALLEVGGKIIWGRQRAVPKQVFGSKGMLDNVNIGTGGGHLSSYDHMWSRLHLWTANW